MNGLCLSIENILHDITPGIRNHDPKGEWHRYDAFQQNVSLHDKIDIAQEFQIKNIEISRESIKGRYLC